MFTFTGSYCHFPRATYSAADLPAEYHMAVRERFRRAAERDILPAARSREEAEGLRERCDEIASEMYLHWLALRSPKIARGDHSHAVAAVIRYFRLTGWHGMTGYRRSQNRKATAEVLAWKERRRAALQDRPDAVAMARERVSGSPALSRKAYRLAEKSGIPGGVPALLTLATLAECSRRGRFIPQPTPTRGVPATPGDGTEWRAARE